MVKKLFFLGVILISFLSAYPLLSKGFPPTHDGEYHVVRFYEFNRNFMDGNLYPRWAPDLNNGYGVPLFNFVYPFPNYAAALMHALGFSFIDAFKINLFIAAILGSIFFYLWAREFWEDWGALVSAAFYSFSPYHLLDIYIRGSVGEVWALTFAPGFLWSITKFVKKKNGKNFLFSVTFLSLLIFSHNILALMLSLFTVFYAFFLLRNYNFRSFIGISYLFILGIGLSAVFWLPALLEKRYVRGLEVYDYSSNFPELYQLIIPSWGSGFAGAGLQNQLSYQIGLANLLVVFISFIFLLRKDFKNKRLILFFLVSFFLIFFLMLEISKPLWNTIPLVNYFQFPWRLLSLEIILCAFLAGAVTLLWKKRIISILLIILSVSLGLGYTGYAYYHQRNDEYYTSRSNFIDGTNSPGNAFNTIWVGDLKKQEKRIAFPKGELLNQVIKSTKYSFEATSLNGGEVLVNTVYFPGWNARVDGKPKKLTILKDGNFSFRVPSGEHRIEVVFENTPIRNLATFVTFISLLFLLLNLRRSVKIKE